MKKVLFISESVSLAHVIRPYKLAEQIENDFEIYFACSKDFRHLLIEKDWKFYSINTLSNVKFTRRLKLGMSLFSKDELRNKVKEDINLITTIKPDLIVGDLRFSLTISARIMNIPFITITNAHWSPHLNIEKYPLPDLLISKIVGLKFTTWIYNKIQKFAFYTQARNLNKLRLEYKLMPYKSTFEQQTDSDITCFADLPEVIPLKKLDAHQFFLGPILWSPNVTLPIWWNEIQKKKYIYITPGTTGDIKDITKILELVESKGLITVLATAGKFKMNEIKNKRYVAEFLPGELMAKLSQLVICNGGSATVYQSISANTPVIGLCSNMDQFLTMMHIENYGAGIHLRSSNLKMNELSDSIDKILTNNHYKEKAIALSNSISSLSNENIFKKIVIRNLNLDTNEELECFKKEQDISHANT